MSFLGNMQKYEKFMEYYLPIAIVYRMNLILWYFNNLFYYILYRVLQQIIRYEFWMTLYIIPFLRGSTSSTWSWLICSGFSDTTMQVYCSIVFLYIYWTHIHHFVGLISVMSVDIFNCHVSVQLIFTGHILENDALTNFVLRFFAI